MATFPIASSDRQQSSIADTLSNAPVDIIGPLSAWSDSRSKRLFDLVCVIGALPIVVPLLFVSALAVRLTSSGPVLFHQKRMGRHRRLFTIYKFRTMPVRNGLFERPTVTTSTNQRFTPVGPFLRRWKLDELPQIINVLRGDMSLVGPRPKLPEHQISDLACRPGITGHATCVFAHEETVFAGISEDELNSLNINFVLPFKERLDRNYMSTASCASDLQLILRSIFRKWRHFELQEFVFSPHRVGANEAPSITRRSNGRT
jgi:lipopolysaccharide/colanic/teichoic acid biosynthesis glycosyltransferase